MIYIIFVVLLIMIGRIPSDINESYLFLDIVNYSGMGITVFFIISLFISAVKTKGGKRYEKG